MWGYWYPCFRLPVMSTLGVKARVGSLICASQRHMCYIFPKIHFWCKTFWPLGGQHLPHACEQVLEQALVVLKTRVYHDSDKTLYRLSYAVSVVFFQKYILTFPLFAKHAMAWLYNLMFEHLYLKICNLLLMINTPIFLLLLLFSEYLMLHAKNIS